MNIRAVARCTASRVRSGSIGRNRQARERASAEISIRVHPCRLRDNSPLTLSASPPFRIFMASTRTKARSASTRVRTDETTTSASSMVHDTSGVRLSQKPGEQRGGFQADRLHNPGSALFSSRSRSMLSEDRLTGEGSSGVFPRRGRVTTPSRAHARSSGLFLSSLIPTVLIGFML